MLLTHIEYKTTCSISIEGGHPNHSSSSVQFTYALRQESVLTTCAKLYRFLVKWSLFFVFIVFSTPDMRSSK